jgi:hypothetical protein
MFRSATLVVAAVILMPVLGAQSNTRTETTEDPRPFLPLTLDLAKATRNDVVEVLRTYKGARVSMKARRVTAVVANEVTIECTFDKKGRLNMYSMSDMRLHYRDGTPFDKSARTVGFGSDKATITRLLGPPSRIVHYFNRGEWLMYFWKMRDGLYGSASLFLTTGGERWIEGRWTLGEVEVRYWNKRELEKYEDLLDMYEGGQR